ncbi:YicS family protein [Pantoea agglomerans]|uniref:YicS family protein n=1 Tax=Enterobacter agglomerans TaxID=549 RepID=UPI003E351323
MNLTNVAVGSLLLISALPLLASPYQSLEYALKEQKIISDLRTHCTLGENISDEKIRSVFLSNESSHDLILAAAKALSAGNQQVYAESVEKIQCPDIK